MTLEKLEGRRNLRARHGSRLTVSSLHGLHVYTESEAKEVCWFTWRSLECPSTSRTLFSGLRVSAHGKQVAPLFGQVLTDFARGGRRANSSPGPARGKDFFFFFFFLKGYYHMGHNARKCPFRQNSNYQRNKIDLIEKCFLSIKVFI